MKSTDRWRATESGLILPRGLNLPRDHWWRRQFVLQLLYRLLAAVVLVSAVVGVVVAVR